MRCFFLFTLFLTSLSATAEVRKIALIGIGAGKDSATTTLLDSAERTDLFLKKNGYESLILHDLTAQNRFTKAIDNLTSEQQTGKLKANDQVILFLHGHGEPKRGTEVGHKVDIGSKPNFSEIREKIRALTAAGIKVAVVDYSCFSGNTLELGLAGACVISAQNRGTMAAIEAYDNILGKRLVTGSFSHEVLKAMKANRNLEEVFLRARRNMYFVSRNLEQKQKTLWDAYTINDMPEISTKEHLQIRPIWDRLFFLTEDIVDYRDFTCDKMPFNTETMADTLNSAKFIFGSDFLTYGKFLELFKHRLPLIEELAQIDNRIEHIPEGRAGTKQDQDRREKLIKELNGTEHDYLNAMDKFFNVERELYEDLYKSFKSKTPEADPCRDFKI